MEVSGKRRKYNHRGDQETAYSGIISERTSRTLPKKMKHHGKNLEDHLCRIESASMHLG
ncbi:hypothetical protein BVRB_3g048470 [Beta vulgaris subsp. vulgaris]|nr:hypothetical protein BVRB_3g048470 [Beta vulgaris subsp. vulgaris]